MSFAIIKTGGKQYKVEEGETFQVEKIDIEEGEKLTFDEVLLKSDGKNTEVGSPFVNGAKVEAEIVGHGKGDKKIVYKYKPKKRQRKKKGHRQPYTEIKITSIK